MIKLYLQKFDGIILNEIDKNSADNLFSSGYTEFVEEIADYYVYRVEPENSELPHEIICFSELPCEINNRVMAAYCRKVNSREHQQRALGVIISSEQNEYFEARSAEVEAVIEHLALVLNDELYYQREDYRVNNYKSGYDFSRNIESSVKELYAWMDAEQKKSVFLKAEYKSSHPLYRTDRLSIDLSSVCSNAGTIDINRRTDLHMMSKTQDIWVLGYRGMTQGFVHFIPLPYGFSFWYGSLETKFQRLFSEFVNSVSFRIIGRALHHSRNYIRNNLTIWDGVIARGFNFVGSKGKEPHVRMMSMPLNEENLFEKIIFDGAELIKNGRFSLVEIKEKASGKRNCVLYKERPRTERISDTGKKEDNEQDMMDNREMLSVKDHEEVDIDISNQKNRYSPDYFASEIKNRNIGILQYDILETVALFRYITIPMIFRLINSDYLPFYKSEMSPEQEVLFNEIRTETVTKPFCLTEGEKSYEFEAKLASANNKLNKTLQRLYNMDFLGSLGFKIVNGQTSKKSGCKSYFLKKSGGNLLAALQRKNKKVDMFAFARSVFDIKSTLSANQLCIAYICALHGIRGTISEIKTDCYLKGESCAAKLGFRMTLQSQEKAESRSRIILLGESIRNTSGVTRNYGEMSIAEKYPRLIGIANTVAESEAQHVFLTFVFPSYSEMVSRASFLWNIVTESEKSEYLHVFLTYDILTMAPFDDMHFAFDNEGKLFRAKDITTRIDRVLTCPSNAVMDNW